MSLFFSLANKDLQKKSLKVTIIIFYVYTWSAKQLFILENALKKLLNIFSNFFSYLKVQSFGLIMENNFTEMAASAGHAVAYTTGPVFKQIIDYVQLYFTNSFTNIAL